ncbi:MAG: hypothetical protein ACLP9L_38325 [Thermoguttaceae bacterium]
MPANTATLRPMPPASVNLVLAAPGEAEAQGEAALDINSLVQQANRPVQPAKAYKPDRTGRKKSRITSTAVSAIVAGTLVLGGLISFLIALIVTKPAQPTVVAETGLSQSQAPPKDTASPGNTKLAGQSGRSRDSESSIPSGREERSSRGSRAEPKNSSRPLLQASTQPPVEETSSANSEEQPPSRGSEAESKDSSHSLLQESTELPVKPPEQGHHTWKVRNPEDSIEADLGQIEQDVLVLKKPDGSFVRVPYDRCVESDQEYASNWVISAAKKIWTPEGSSLQSSRNGANSQIFERRKADELNKTLKGAFFKDTLTVVDVSARKQGRSGLALKVQSTRNETPRLFILPVPESVGLKIALRSRLIVDGRVSYKFDNCPACGGRGYFKCSHCSHGKVSRMVPRVIPFPNGAKVVQEETVYDTCKFCNGTGRGGTCEHHLLLGDWEPFGSRKLPDGAYSFLTASSGAHLVYVMLDDVRFRIYTPTKLLSFRKKDGKLIADTVASQ